MVNKFEQPHTPYTLEEARKEADKLREKIEEGEAATYSEAEQLLSEERFQKIGHAAAPLLSLVENEEDGRGWLERKLGKEYRNRDEVRKFSDRIDGKSLPLQLVGTTGERIYFFDHDGTFREEACSSLNAKKLLSEIKESDREIGAESHALRNAILQRSNNSIRTADAFMIEDISALDEDESALKEYVDQPDHWIAERRSIHDSIVASELELAAALAARAIGHPTIYAMRGNTAAGKTTAMLKDPTFQHILDEHGNIEGEINPDVYKEMLKNASLVFGKQTVTHYQAHVEGSMLARRMKQALYERRGSMVIDERFEKESEILELKREAEKTGRHVVILDVDCPLEVSLVRVLARFPGGSSPLAPFKAVAEGYAGTRKHRPMIVHKLLKRNDFPYYNLIVQDESGQRAIAAKKENGVFSVLDEERFAVAMDQGTESEIERMRGTVIDETYIQAAGERLGLSSEQKQALFAHRGRTFEEALAKHVTLVRPEALDAETYEQAALANLSRTSRTTRGVVDVSASADKKGQMSDLNAEEVIKRTQDNFTETIRFAYEHKDRVFADAAELADFLESFARMINNGITKEGVLFRSGEDSAKYPYLRVIEIPFQWRRFCADLYSRLNDPLEDPISVAAWAEYKIDLSDHCFADGCGRIAKTVSAWILMRGNKHLPDYTIGGTIPESEVRSNYYHNAPKTIPGTNKEMEQAELEHWNTYYHSLFH